VQQEEKEFLLSWCASERRVRSLLLLCLLVCKLDTDVNELRVGASAQWMEMPNIVAR